MKWAVLVVGVVFFLAAGVGAMDWALLGFPDGHLTAFERETQGLRGAAIVANLGLGLLACAWAAGWAAGWIPPATQPATQPATFGVLILGALILAAGLLIVVVPGALLPHCPRLSSCVLIYKVITGHPPDHGVGG
ncbi:hypothetical protein [Xanthobacter autotrophicus]|uniref:hypothetical protein n=1 Tax=Xanthobacter autotrophicus TaxID=280 RepID=UPI00372CBF24